MAYCFDNPYPTASGYFHERTPAGLATCLATMELQWWPVGQGLFMSGRLRGTASGQFNWVYDCGSSSGVAERDNAVRAFHNELMGQRIDLVTLSHFDSDHINGIVAVIRGVPVRTLLLPYVPLWQRLLIALGEEIGAADPIFDFYIDPAAYLTGIEGAEIDGIVFVPGAGPDDIVASSEETPAPDRPIEGGEPEYGSPPEESDGDPAVCRPKSVAVRFLKPGGRVVIPSLWEFAPYNDAKMQPLASAAFVDQVKRVARFLVAYPAQRTKALRCLKKIYSLTFGRGRVPANLISLFLYSGPVDARIRFKCFRSTAPFALNVDGDNLAQLATGDGFVNTPARLAALQHFYSEGRRLERAGLLQIMHHGARDNWQAGLADILKPAASIFSSDPGYTPGHPHPEVLRDFWPWSPVRVDKVTGFHLTAILELP